MGWRGFFFSVIVVKFSFSFGSCFSGWMYSHFGTLNEATIILGCIQILAAVLATCLYADMKLQDGKTDDVTTPLLMNITDKQ